MSAVRVETQESLAERFAAEQEVQLALIEKDSKLLTDHILYWDSVRKENIIGYYCRKEGITRLGMQPLPVLPVLEYKSKEAIKLKLLLTSLSKSEFAHEQWTLSECSAEIINTKPKNCFKKKPYTVTVYFGNDPENRFPYTNWDYIYYEDENSTWHKAAGQVDENGLFFKDNTGDLVYFTLFLPDAERYGHSGKWTIKYKNETVFTSVTSSGPRAIPGPSDETDRSTTYTTSPAKTPTSRKRRIETDEDTTSHSPTSTSSGFRLRGGEQQGERSPSRRRRRGILSGVPSPEEVGSGSRTVQRKNLTRVGRLQAEAWDPPLICLKGSANTLKCFRYRLHQKHAHSFISASTAFHWVGNDESARILVAFKDSKQRETFLNHVTLPKGTDYCLGSLDCL
ncbi:E2 [Human papillomavirus KC5]|uniref:E2 n=1 Tax=Human papillomavirus KC5 TaxID=1647924 RepID=UPI000290CBCC|nr:E2 [Human papillomavirus KC5]AFV27142.1 E2 [Human papillomavirus KC5]